MEAAVLNETARGETGEEPQDVRLRQLHRVMLMMLKDFAILCERHDLRWFVAYGTALGAVRHRGFIPWDDDLDICMPREDLDRFVRIVQEGADERYAIMNSQVDASYPMATTRLMLKGTEFRDAALQTMAFESCIFLDLFPLDNLADDERLFRRQAWRAWLYNKLSMAKLVKSPYIAGNGMRAFVLRAGSTCMRGLLNLPGVRSVDFNELSLKEQVRYNDQDTRRIGFLCDTDRFWSVYEWEDVFPARLVPFEDVTVPIARRAEKLLEGMYGDYLKLPPLDQRKEHYPEILDFGEYAAV